MSIGNLKDSGNQGNNFPWQLKMLLGQQCACDELSAINANTDQVEFLLSAILTALQDGTEYEAKFVIDTCDSDKIYLEVRIWDPTPAPGSWGPITYYLPGSSTPVTPVGEGTPGCLQYTDPTGVLGQILAELQLQTPLLTTIDSNVAQLVTNTTSANRTPNLIRPSGIFGNTPVGTYSVSFASVGTANATVGGMILKPGETVNFDGGAMNNTLGVIAYDTTLAGAELIITYLI
jgi:hypothetical protein